MLEQLDLKNDIGQGGMTVLSIEGRKRSVFEQHHGDRDVAMIGMDTESGSANTKVIMSFNKVGVSGSNDENKHSSRVSTTMRSARNERSNKNEPSVYEKFISIIKSDVRHQDGEETHTALMKKKRLAKRKFTALQQGVDINEISINESDNENEAESADQSRSQVFGTQQDNQFLQE